MNNKSTNILRYPSFFKGVSRVMDFFGSIDKYKYSNNPDSELTQRDWEIVGNDLRDSINFYESRQTCNS